ncbi:Iron-sulfur cluster carrier protein [subsurface metagenome]
MTIDPRLAVIQKRLTPIKRTIVFSSAKGGVGKSICAVASALALAQLGFRTGILDLDFQGASAHVLLGQTLSFPEEASGIKPFQVNERLDFMSFAAFSREHPVPLRGSDVTQAIIELLAITIWKELDFLIVDMPPGIGDEILDLLRFMDRAEFIVIATPSRVVLRVVGRLLEMLESLEVPVIGVIENMAAEAAGSTTKALAKRYQTALLGSIPYIDTIDRFIGSPDALLNSVLGLKVKQIISSII